MRHPLGRAVNPSVREEIADGLPVPGPFPRIPRRRMIVVIVIVVGAAAIFAFDSGLATVILDLISISVACIEIVRYETAALPHME